MVDLMEPFWQRKALEELDDAEWESLCDGCGRCCLIKLEDLDDGGIYFTDVVCRLFDERRCRCSSYAQRSQEVPDCLPLRPLLGGLLTALPESCAYRRIAEGRGLAEWHPLVSGDPESVHRAGISVRGRVITETAVDPDDLEEHIIGF
jgi:uncharacterized cysteine cluster protein YcgN (CxxCxxCC family)